MADEKFRIDIETLNIEKANKGMNELADKLEKVSKVASNLNFGDKNLQTFVGEMKQLSGMVNDYSRVIKTAASTNKELTNVDIQASKAMMARAQAEAGVIRVTTTRTQAEIAAARAESARLKVQQDAIRLTNMQAAADAKAAQAALKGGAYSQLTKSLSEYTTKLKDAIAAGNVHGAALQNMGDKYKRIQSELTGVNGKFVELTGATGNTDGVTQMLSRSIASFIGNTLSMWLQNAARDMINFGREISNSGIALDSLRNTMMAAAGGWSAGGVEIKWLLDMSNKLGVSFGDVSDSYAKFMTSFTRSGGTIGQSRQVFQDISAAMVSLHLPAERMQGVFVALEQMANKGTVQAEELKRQLGNALPGAFELAAESMGILPSKLMEMMKKGEVFSKDFLPNFAKTVKDVLGQGVGIAVDQFNANLNRLSTGTSLLKMELGQGLNAALLPFVKILVQGMNALANGARFFNENAAAAATLKAVLIPVTLALGAMVATLTASTVAFISAQVSSSAFFVAMGAGMKSLIADAIALNASLGGLPLIIGIVATAAAGLGFYLSDVSKSAADISTYIGLRGQLVELTKSITSVSASTQEGKDTIAEYKQEFPQLTAYLLETGKQFKDLSKEELAHITVLGVHDARMRALSERTVELASWQNTLSAVWGVAWANIQKWTAVAGENIMWTLGKIGSGIKLLLQGLGGAITNMAKSMNTLGILASAAGSKLGIVGTPLKMWGDQMSTMSGGVLNFGENVNKAGDNIKNMGSAIKQWGANTAFGIDVTNKKLEIANKNFINKFKEINKGAAGSIKALQQAQLASNGLGGDGGKDGDGKNKGKGSGKTQSETEWDKFNKEISAMEELIKVRELNGQSISDLVPKYVRLKAQQDAINKSVSDLTDAKKGSWDIFTKEISAIEDQIRARKLDGKSIDDLVPKYVRLKAQQDAVNRSMQSLTSNELVTGWKKLEKDLKETEDTYKGMLSNSAAFTTSELRQQESLMKGMKVKVQYNKALEESSDLMGISNRAASQLADTLVDDLFTPLSEGESIWGRFQDAGLAAFKALATDWVKTQAGMLSKGFQAGWATDAETSLMGKFGNGITGMIQGGKRLPIEGTADNPTGLGSSISDVTGQAADAIKGLDGVSTGFASSITDSLSPALSEAVSGIGGIVSPAASAASGIATMAASTPVAAMGTGAMAMGMAVLAPAATAAAPAMVTMGAALATIAANASAAAIAMADLAIATAANSVAGIPILGAVLAPIAALATGAAITAGTAMVGAGIAAGTVIAGAGNMVGGGMTGIGNLLSGSSSVTKHARGGVVSSPTTFPMSGGNIGVAGEAGTEVIAPARRMSNGDVGVGAVASNVIVNNYANAAVEVIKRPNNEMEIKVTELNAMLSSSRTNKGMTNAQSRLSTKGRQVG